jgi:hypothetical protein
MGDDKNYSVDLYFLFSASGGSGASGKYKMSVIVKEWTAIPNTDMTDYYATLIPYKEGATVKVYTAEINGMMLSSATLTMNEFGEYDWVTLEYDKFKLKAFDNNSDVAVLQGLHIADASIPPKYVLVVIEC